LQSNRLRREEINRAKRDEQLEQLQDKLRSSRIQEDLRRLENR
jgi:hypothetical protein